MSIRPLYLKGTSTSFTIANIMEPSSHPKAFTSLNRTKHRNATAINDMHRKVIVTTKIGLLRPTNVIFTRSYKSDDMAAHADCPSRMYAASGAKLVVMDFNVKGYKKWRMGKKEEPGGARGDEDLTYAFNRTSSPNNSRWYFIAYPSEKPSGINAKRCHKLV